jgi:hypothetical protein
MTATTQIQRPHASQPLPPPPATVRRGRMTGWTGGSLVLLAFGLAIGWGAATYLEMVDDLAALRRVPIPSTQIVLLDAGRQVLSVEGDRQAAIPDLRFAVLTPDGVALHVDPYVGDLRYDVPDEPGRVGRAVATFDADSPGRYTVRVDGRATSGAVVAIGEDAPRAALPSILGALALLVASIVGGAILLALGVARTRGGGRR